MSEFTEWAERFEAREFESYKTGQRNISIIPPQCMYPVKEGPHKVAHLVDAEHRSVDGYPACSKHKGLKIRPAWRGYVEGA